MIEDREVGALQLGVSRAGDVEIDFELRQGRAERLIARQQPAQIEGGRDLAGERAAGRRLRQGLRQDLEGAVGEPEQALARFGQFYALGRPPEELDAQHLLQQLHLPADGARRDVEFGAGAGKALMPCRGIEGAQAVERRQGPRLSFPKPREFSLSLRIVAGIGHVGIMSTQIAYGQRR